MTPIPGTPADFETLRHRAIALRRAGHSLRQIRDELKVFNNDTLHRLVKGEPPPEWTRRPNAKDGLRERARELRRAGWTYDRIQAELGCSRSSVSLWVRDLPKPEPRHTPEQQRALMNEGLAAVRAAQDRERAATKRRAAADVGELSDRELFLIGVGLYWAEGGKDKPYDRRECVVFVNSDPGMIRVFLAWLRLVGVEGERIRYTVAIHENADVAGAERYWADLVGADASAFNRTTLKKHNPRTVRRNTGDGYRGCLVIKVRKGADLYRRIEGWWCGIVGAATSAD